jgi:XTP/dITP diphosphohydrolase
VELCFASNNNHKLSEIRLLLEPDFSVLSLREIGCFDELPETRDTLEGNSLQKAEFVYDKFKLPCFADDTGLEVMALNNEPGVFSARYAGEHKSSEDNIKLLLKNLAGIADRRARFRSVITLVGLKEIQFFEGVVAGVITDQKKGEEGFGYDPVFQPEGYHKTFAEMNLVEKNRISHRALALQKLIAWLKHCKADNSGQ